MDIEGRISTIYGSPKGRTQQLYGLVSTDIVQRAFPGYNGIDLLVLRYSGVVDQIKLEMIRRKWTAGEGSQLKPEDFGNHIVVEAPAGFLQKGQTYQIGPTVRIETLKEFEPPINLLSHPLLGLERWQEFCQISLGRIGYIGAIYNKGSIAANDNIIQTPGLSRT